MVNVHPVQQDLRYVKEFFDLNDDELKTSLPMNMSRNTSMPMATNNSLMNRFYPQSQYMNEISYSPYYQPSMAVSRFV